MLKCIFKHLMLIYCSTVKMTELFPPACVSACGSLLLLSRKHTWQRKSGQLGTQQAIISPACHFLDMNLEWLRKFSSFKSQASWRACLPSGSGSWVCMGIVTVEVFSKHCSKSHFSWAGHSSLICIFQLMLHTVHQLALCLLPSQPAEWGEMGLAWQDLKVWMSVAGFLTHKNDSTLRL